MVCCDIRVDLIGFYSIIELSKLQIEFYRAVLLTASELDLVMTNYYLCGITI